MKYSLRTLLVLAIVTPPLLAAGHYFFKAYAVTIKEYGDWIVKESGTTVTWVGAVVLAYVLVRTLNRVSQIPVD